MDGSTINVTDLGMNISIEPGGYRVYGNKPTLSTESFNSGLSLSLSPNPSTNYFTLNGDSAKVQMYSLTGQLVKSFVNQSANYQFPIADLNSGIYIVKVVDDNGNEKSLKLVKQ